MCTRRLTNRRAATALALLFLAAGVAGCAEADHDDDKTETESDSDSDSDTDSDTDTDADGDADTDYQPPDYDGPRDTGLQDTGEPCDDESEVALFLSPDDSNSMSSPAQVQAMISGGYTDLGDVPIRTWEFLNYYDFAYSPPSDDGLVLDAQLVAGREAGAYTMQLALTSPRITNDERDPVNLTFSLDISDSMDGDPFDLLKHTCRQIATQLKGGDVVSIVGWNEFTYTILDSHPVTGPDDATLLASIDGLSLDWGTDLYGGLATAFQLTDSNRSDEYINRVMLISDGRANLGETDAEVIGQYAADSERSGIYLVGVGAGKLGTYNDTLMDEATDLGKGATLYVADQAEVEKWFGDGHRLVNILGVAAREVQLELELPPGFEIVRTSVEEHSTVSEEVTPQNLAPNDSMVFHLDIATCAPELLEDDSEIRVAARWKDAISFEEQAMEGSYAFADLLAGDSAMLRKGAAVFSYAEALKAYKHGTSESWSNASAVWLAAQDLAEAANPDDEDLATIRSVMRALGAPGA